MYQFHVGSFVSSEFYCSKEKSFYIAPWTRETETVFLSLLSKEYHARWWLPSIVENNRRLLLQQREKAIGALGPAWDFPFLPISLNLKNGTTAIASSCGWSPIPMLASTHWTSTLIAIINSPRTFISFDFPINAKHPPPSFLHTLYVSQPPKLFSLFLSSVLMSS